MHARSWFSSISAAVIVLGLGVAVTACSKQGEGERCSTDNGNDDCEAPLLCTSAGVCCPTSGATAQDCKGATLTDTGTPETTPTEGGADTADTADSTPAETAADTADTSTPADTTSETPADTAEAGD